LHFFLLKLKNFFLRLKISICLYLPAEANLIPDPSQCSPLVVEYLIKSGLSFYNKPVLEKSAPYPPVAIITTPYSYFLVPSLS
jgi:hypothetical protein